MTELVYDNGYVYSTGIVYLGAPCVAPILEFTNHICEEVVVVWQNRLVFGDDDIPIAMTCANQLRVKPGELALITNLYPSIGWKRSLLTIEGPTSGLDAYIFGFGADCGYYLQRIPSHWTRDPCTNELVLHQDFQVPPRSRAVVGTAYRPGFCGNFQPRWRDCLFLPTKLLPLPPLQPLRPCDCSPNEDAQLKSS